MNKKFEELAEQAGYHPDVYELCKPGMEKFAELIFNECVKAVKATPTHCAFTTRDLDIVNGTIDNSVKSLYNHFNIKAPL